jgi:hypothetical protein
VTEVEEAALDGGLRRMGVAYGAAFGTGFVLGLTLILLMIVPFLMIPSDPKLIMSPLVLLVTVPVMSILTSMAIAREIERGGSKTWTIGGAMGAVSGIASMIAFGLMAPWFDLFWIDISSSSFPLVLFFGVAAAISGIPIGIYVAKVLTQISGSPERPLRWILVLGMLLGFLIGAMAPPIVFLVVYAIGFALGPLLD